MQATIEIANRQKRIPLNPTQIIRTIREVLDFLGVSQARLSCVFVTDREIKRLNRQYLKRSHATDVLAFDLRPDSARMPGRRCRRLDGEIIVSATTASRQARCYHNTPYQELILYLVHGILHLQGYDDHDPAAVRAMRAMEQKLMRRLFGARTQS